MFRNTLFLLISSLIFSTSCTTDSSKSEGNVAFLGGEIINPTTNYIIIHKARHVIDTVYLNERNRFNYKFENLNPGVYSFYDGKEAQFLLLQPNDSLMFRLNTIEFDESLQFTGKGAKENNYLLDLFLLNESHEKTILSISQLAPNEFDKRLSKITNIKREKLNNFIERYKPSDLFKTLAKANINYNHYYSKEFYPFAHYAKSEATVYNNLPSNFYDYRKDINYNDTLLKNYYPYVTFLRAHFSNRALETHFNNSDDSIYNPKCLGYNLNKLDLISESVTDSSIKNGLLFHSVSKLIEQTKNIKGYDKLFNSFAEKSTNKKNVNDVVNFVETYKRLSPKQPIPNVVLINREEEEIPIQNLVQKKPTVFYFWTLKNNHHLKNSHKIASKLQNKYPEVNFIALNTDNISSREQADILKRKGLKLENEYRFENPKNACDLLSIKPITKVFIVDSNGEIINPKANMFSIEFEKELTGLLNQITN